MRLFIFVNLIIIFIFYDYANASIESSLMGLKSVLLGSILPVFAVMALGFAAFSFFTGNPNSKQHLTYAGVGVADVEDELADEFLLGELRGPDREGEAVEPEERVEDLFRGGGG
jgi:hypothetical protein